MSADDSARLEIPRPRVIWAERGDPDAVSPGDQACLLFGPGLLRFLEADLGSGLTPGTGFAPRWVLPLTAGASACYYLGSPRGRESLNSWTATRSRFTWARAWHDGETVEARARIVRVGRTSIRFGWSVESAEQRCLMAEGELTLVSRAGQGARAPVLRLPGTAAGEAGTPAAAPDAGASRARRSLASRVRGLARRLLRYRARLLAWLTSVDATPLDPEPHVHVAASDPAPAEVYYVREGTSGGDGTRGLATSADDLLAHAGALLGEGRCDDLCARPAGGAAVSTVDSLCAFARRLPPGGATGVCVIGPRDLGDDADLHYAVVRALHPQVRVTTATEALLAFLDCYTPVPLAAALPPSHGRADGRQWRHPIRILGRGIPIAPGQPHRVRLPATWWEPGDVCDLAVRRDGALIARRAPKAGEAPAIEFMAEGRAGYELAVALHPCALQRRPLPVPEWPPNGRFLEWPREPDAPLASFEAPRLLHACHACPGTTMPGDSWSWVFPPSLLRLLYSPIGGGAEPLGRRAHPLGGIAAAAVVHAAMQALGGAFRPCTMAVRWRHPIDPQAGFLVHLHVGRCDAGEVEIASRLEQPPVSLADVSLTLRAASAEAHA